MLTDPTDTSNPDFQIPNQTYSDMMKNLLFAATLLSAGSVCAQGYVFTVTDNVAATPVKNQAQTGTCWCFATTSFLESELLRKGKGEHDLSEMFIVRQKLQNQLDDNYLRRGKGNIGAGSLSPTYFNAFRQVGVVPEEVYGGINYDSKTHNHGELMPMLHAVAEVAIKQKKRSPQYYEVVDGILDTYLGEVPEKFSYRGKEYTPQSFAKSLELNLDDYVNLTSFTHHPYYESFILEVPDNWEHASMYNLPLDELMSTIDGALSNGYSVCWDGDVSEKGFAFKKGAAINPEINDLSRFEPADTARFSSMKTNERLDEILKFEKPYPEVAVTPEVRQKGFESFVTTDDHLMHLTGIAKDQNGTKYYVTKNSWGTERNDAKGYLNMSDSFVRAKTIYVMMHKDALPKSLKARLGIK